MKCNTVIPVTKLIFICLLNQPLSFSLSHSVHSGRSSLRSSTDDDDAMSSRNSSICTPRWEENNLQEMI